MNERNQSEVRATTVVTANLESTYHEQTAEKYPLVQFISPNGTLVSEANSMYDPEQLKTMYGHMLRARMFDRKAIHLQRQGRIGTYAPYEGQEAAQVGSALALRDEDWMFPTYRDHGATMTYGQSLLRVLLYWVGRNEGCIPPEGKRIAPPSVPIATQMLHAVGASWAEKLKETKHASIVYFGDGATSEGDFHEGLNFASVYEVPVVFFCQNNGYAISVPMHKQMRTKTIAQKALAYDMRGIRVDGNDVLAVYEATSFALEQAREYGEPTFIEAVTWRYGAHTTADDPSKYRDQQLSEKKRDSDPLLRVEKLLQDRGEWDERWIKNKQEEIEEELDLAVTEMEAYPQADAADMFDHVFEQATWNVSEQRSQFLSKEE